MHGFFAWINYNIIKFKWKPRGLHVTGESLKTRISRYTAACMHGCDIAWIIYIYIVHNALFSPMQCVDLICSSIDTAQRFYDRGTAGARWVWGTFLWVLETCPPPPSQKGLKITGPESASVPSIFHNNFI
jgi:hypothetical protein